MNTLSKKVTRKFYSSEDGFATLQAHWSAAVRSKQVLPAHLHLLYAILRGKDYRRGFGRVTNKVKLENGANPQQGLFQAMNTLQYKIRYYPHDLIRAMGDTVSKEGLKEILSYVPGTNQIQDLNTGGAYFFQVPAASPSIPEMESPAPTVKTGYLERLMKTFSQTFNRVFTA